MLQLVTDKFVDPLPLDSVIDIATMSLREAFLLVLSKVHSGKTLVTGGFSAYKWSYLDYRLRENGVGIHYAGEGLVVTNGEPGPLQDGPCACRRVYER